MRRLRLGRDVSAAPADVWDLLVDTARWPTWGPSITAVEAPVRRIGPQTTGRVRTVLGVWLPFRVTGFEPGSSWEWRVAGVPATGHEIEPRGARSCRVTFTIPLPVFPYALVVWPALGAFARLAEDGANRP